MGNDTSLPLARVPPGFSTMSLSIQSSDSITVLHSDSRSLSTIRQAIIGTWPFGIQQEKPICGTGWMFKVEGAYWKHSELYFFLGRGEHSPRKKTVTDYPPRSMFFRRIKAKMIRVSEGRLDETALFDVLSDNT